MANDDLFAGLVVKGKQIPEPQIAAEPKKQKTSEYDDLFQDYAVKGEQTQAQRRKLSREMEHPGQPPSRETRATRELPELGGGGLLAGEDPGRVAAISPVLLATTDPNEIAQILTAQFPSIGIQQDERGNLIAGNNRTGTKVVINKPGISKLDVLQGLGIVAAFTPAGRAATIGTQGAKVGAKMAAQRAAQAGAASAATEAAIQGGQAVAGGEFSGSDVALAGGLAGISELVPVAFQGARQARQGARLSVKNKELAEVIPAVQSAETAQKALKQSTGKDIRLFKGQKTMVPSQLEEQSFVGSLSSGARKAREQLLLQNKEASELVDGVLDIIGPNKSIQTAPSNVREAASTKLTNLLTKREKATEQLYKQAFKEADKKNIYVNVSPITRKIDDVLIDAPEGGSLQKTLSKVKGFLKSDKTDAATKPNLRKLQNAKFELDNMLEGPAGNSLDSTVKRQVAAIKNELTSKMSQASPFYKKANKVYETLSGPIDKYKKTTLGKIASIEDTQLKNVSRRLFDASETNPAVIRESKKVIESVNPKAWKEITRAEIERRLGTVRASLNDQTTIENIPGQLHRAIFGNQQQRKTLFAGVDGEVKKNLEWLDSVLSRAKAGRPGGSQTATREEIKKSLRRGAWQAISEFFQSPYKTVSGVGADASFNRKVRALANIAYDPKWKSQIEKMRKLEANTPAEFRAMAQLLRMAQVSNKPDDNTDESNR